MTPRRSDPGIRQSLLVLGAAGLLAGLTLALKIMPYNQVARWLPRSGPVPVPPWRKRQISHAVGRAAKWVPGATCLPQAMAGYIMLSRRGFESRIRVGVLQEDGVPFRAHAVLVSGSDVVIGGGGDADKFVLLTELRPGR